MKMEENKFIKLFAIGPLVFIGLFILAVTLFVANESKANYKNALNKIENDLVNAKNEAIKSKINGISQLVKYQNSLISDKLTTKVKDRVITAHKIASQLYDQNKNIKTTKEIQSLIKTTLRPLLWNDGESFIWILNFKGEFQLAPSYLRHLEGTSIINFQDATGRYVIKEEIGIVKKSKEGFLWDTFTKPNDPTQKHYKQVAFVKAFEPYNWYLGSGEYLDTASKTSDEEVLNSIEKISLNNTEYIFVLDNSGKMLSNYAVPKLIGKNVLKNNIYNTQEIFVKIFDLLSKKESGYISYKWENPKTKIVENKYSYIKKIPNTSWILGSGFYESDIKTIAEKSAKILYNDYNLRLQFIIAIGIVLILILFFLSTLISKYLTNSFSVYRKNIQEKSDELEKSNNKLKNLNETLEHRVQEELLKNKEQEEQLFIQAKMASMGDMIGNIAHQWRQPLSVISTIASGINFQYEYKQLDIKELPAQMDEIVNKTKYLSKTIDTFSNFLKDKKEYKETILQNCINTSIDIIGVSLKFKHIKLIKDINEDNPLKIFTIGNELSQVIINIINNSKDVLIEKKIQDAWIKINLIEEQDFVVITIEDSGGGIPKNIIPRIFEPYFTTKNKSRGTGLGLHMSYKIIVESLKGDIYVKNTENGAKFFIKLPLKTS